MSVLLLAACDVPTRAPDQDYRNFQTRIAGAARLGVTPYWLGRHFTAGGHSFFGPGSGDFGGEVEGGGAVFSYNAVVLPNGGSVGLDITLYTPAAWDKVKAQQDVPAGAPPPPGITVTGVTIAGASGRILETRNRLAGTLDGIRLVVRLGDTIVVAITRPGISPTPGAPDLNPLTDRQTFISVLQRLRPYPQP